MTQFCLLLNNHVTLYKTVIEVWPNENESCSTFMCSMDTVKTWLGKNIFIMPVTVLLASLLY